MTFEGITFICGVFLTFILVLCIALGALAKYLAEKNAEKWQRRIDEERKSSGGE